MSTKNGQHGERALAAIILAAGKGTRMNSDLPKVLHEVAGRPMVEWVVEACDAVGCTRNVVVVGFRGDLVCEALADRDDCEFVEQREQLGTAHAVMCARDALGTFDGDVLVLCGDGPLIRIETLRTLLEVHRRADADATLATSEIADPTGYGRIVRDAGGRFLRIVEHRDATPDERAIREINPSYYCFRTRPLFALLDRIGNDNAKGEYYLTDVFPLLLQTGRTVEVIDAVPPDDVLSINTPEQLAEVDRILSARLAPSSTETRE